MNRFLPVPALLQRTKCLGNPSKVFYRALMTLPGHQIHPAPSSGGYCGKLLGTSRLRVQDGNKACCHTASSPRETLTSAAVATILSGGDAPVLNVTTSTGRHLEYPGAWLRAQCQCDLCFSKITNQRTLQMEDLQPADSMTSSAVSPCGGKLFLEWGSGHKGHYEAEWLLERAFDEKAKQKKRSVFQLTKQLWSEGHQLAKYDYQTLFSDDATLLKALQSVEQHGAVLVTGADVGMEAGYKLSEYIGIAKKTIFGYMCNLYPKVEATNLAYTEKPLNLHTDLVFYEEMPGVVFLHAVRSHDGVGGETVISDGFKAAEVMRQEYPEQFKILAESNAYFIDTGVDANSETREPRPYHKVARGPVINLYPDGELFSIRFSNHLLDSFVDIPLAKVPGFYKALKLFYELNLKNSITFKLADGEMLVGDNYRVLHGKTSVIGISDRHLVTCYCSWDEMRCKRRRLETQLC